MLNKDQLIFDPTAANTDECDTVGSYLLGAGGDAVTSSDLGGGVQALDVNIAGGALNATVDLDFATDQVDASGSVVALDAATLAALENINAVVTATDLDIRDLTFATDSVDVSGSSISISGPVALDASSLAALEDITATVSGTVALDAATLAALESVTVTATDLDIRDLTAATDNIAISDGTDQLAINADGSINVNFSPTGKQNVVETNNGCSHAATSVTNTAAPLITTALADRTTVHIQNLGSRAIYIGCDNTVTSANGTRIPKGASAEFKFSDAVSLHAITDSGTADVRLIELACA